MSRLTRPVSTSALAGAMAALLLAACSGTQPTSEPASEGQEAVHAVHWGYEADNGPDEWGSMDSDWILCAEGREQSPVDLANAAKIDLPQVAIHMPSDQDVEVMNQEGVIDALDNGHTIQINTRGTERMSVGDQTYALVQFHFHAPSEHTLDGEHFPMEMHLVHQAEDDSLAVVGVLVEEGAENPGIAPLWEQLPRGSGTETTLQIPAEFAEQLFSGDPTGVFHYRGSLTTPPCSEGVSWYVRRTPTQLSKDQIAAFTAVYDHNNRPVQALNDRTLSLDEKPLVTAN